MNVIGTLNALPDGLWSLTFTFASGTEPSFGGAIQLGPMPELLWPALALATFLAWKAVWAVAKRRRRQSAPAE
jgi:hypothetical protein